MIPGDGVGPELVDAARRAVEATGVPVSWYVQEAGAEVADREGDPLPERVMESIRETGVALKGPLTTPTGGRYRSANVALRVALDLYACVRPCRSYPGVPSTYEGVDLVVVRETTEGAYTGIEFEQGTSETAQMLRFIERSSGTHVRDDSGLSIKAISDGASERIARFAFDHAERTGRRKVTAGHKANIMKFSDGLFLDAVQRVAATRPEIEFEERIIDNLSMQLVQRPETFDVLVLPNLYGDILSDLCAGLVGGLGLAPGVNLGDGRAVFEPTHGSAPKLRGTGRANPMALMLCGAMLLRHLGEASAGDRLEAAVADVLAEGRTLTYDLRPAGDRRAAASTAEVTEAVLERLAA
ncbi:MAG TPA: isocitrate/isopropylmalate dehydrogenase family protein [Actinomycetota bacterium]